MRSHCEQRQYAIIPPPGRRPPMAVHQNYINGEWAKAPTVVKTAYVNA
jgi:hypothetical protein